MPAVCIANVAKWMNNLFTFTLWTLAGPATLASSLMCLPWAFKNSGIVASLIMISVVGAVSYYTCFLILYWAGPPHGNFGDFGDLCSHYLGPWSKHMANATSVGVCLGVLAAYHVLMATSFQKIILDIGQTTGHDVTFFCCGSGDYR